LGADPHGGLIGPQIRTVELGAEAGKIAGSTGFKGVEFMSTTTPDASFTLAKGKKNKTKKAQPVWEIAESFPLQGEWTEEDYLDLPDDGRKIELVNGCLEYLPMPDILHQRIARFLFLAFHAFVEARKLGEVFYDGTKTKVSEQVRLPDIMIILNDRLDEHTEDYFFGADLLVEVVSGSSKDRKRDFVEKRQSYGESRVAEYWLVDPKLKRITVLMLSGNEYDVHGEFELGEKATSVLLKGFEVDVAEALAGTNR